MRRDCVQLQEKNWCNSKKVKQYNITLHCERFMKPLLYFFSVWSLYSFDRHDSANCVRARGSICDGIYGHMIHVLLLVIKIILCPINQNHLPSPEATNQWCNTLDSDTIASKMMTHNLNKIVHMG